jgi:dTDP-4-amino-4,6-dideoxygalactose transaminase
MNPKIIGGMFGLDSELDGRHSSPPPFLQGRSLTLLNASSALALLAERLAPPHIWMPSYLCDSMVFAVANSPASVRFYPVDADLNISQRDWLTAIQSGDMVVVIDYFGWPCDSTLIAHLKAQGAWVVQDACQALLTTRPESQADFSVFSARKFLGVPDGGILTIHSTTTPDFDAVDLLPIPKEWWLKAFSAVVLRREFDRHGGERLWFKLFQEAEAESPVGFYPMSELSQTLLRHSFDYAAIAASRLRNYQALAHALSHIALFPSLPEGVVPLGFPIRLQERDRVRQVLFEHQIYPPVHWPIQDVVPAEFEASHRLAGEIMTLPCDQRYDEADMENMAAILTQALG